MRVPRRTSALKLDLAGSFGRFKVGKTEAGSSTFEVLFLLTEVGMDFEGDSYDDLLNNLAPVREIFDLQDLDFEHIMQRDIDDARVSEELIPYLLDKDSRETVKLFPPIISVLLPVDSNKKHPLHYYPPIEAFDEDIILDPSTGEKDPEFKKRVIRSGSLGNELFQLEYPVSIEDDSPNFHDYVRLKLNTSKSKLVVVDGQHRAMALLALYRNLKNGWTDEKRVPFKNYYAEWTTSYIQKFNLNKLQLPVLVCVIPEINEETQPDFDLIKAARLIFLTLNKTARKVSNSRNILLDDNDLISVFLRAFLSRVKNSSENSFRIWNVEIDQIADQMIIDPDNVAITGVNHLFFIIEFLMLNELGEVKGITSKNSKFYLRTNLHDCFRRLQAESVMTREQLDLRVTKRRHFTSEVASLLSEQFLACYGKHLEEIFSRFYPMASHNKSSILLKKELEEYENRTIKPILFDGQGIKKVFEDHYANLAQKLEKGYFEDQNAEIEAHLDVLNATKATIENCVNKFKVNRAKNLLSSIIFGKNDAYVERVLKLLLNQINKIFDNVFSSVAFQAALICGFFFEVEKHLSSKAHLGEDVKADFVSAELESYLISLNEFFHPKDLDALKRLLSVFYIDINFHGDYKQPETWELYRTNNVFNHIVQRGDMKPELWPKYRYLLLEMWQSQDAEFNMQIIGSRQDCRQQVFANWFKHKKDEFCKENEITQDKMLEEQILDIFSKSFESFSGFLNKFSRDKGAVFMEQFQGLIDSYTTSVNTEDLEESEELLAIEQSYE